MVPAHPWVCPHTAQHASSAVTQGLGQNLHSKHFPLCPSSASAPEPQLNLPCSLEGLASSRTGPCGDQPSRLLH